MFEFLKRLYVKENSIFYSIIQNTKNKQIIFEEKNFILYKLTEFELFENAIIFCNNLALKHLNV